MQTTEKTHWLKVLDLDELPEGRVKTVTMAEIIQFILAPVVMITACGLLLTSAFFSYVNAWT